MMKKKLKSKGDVFKMMNLAWKVLRVLIGVALIEKGIAWLVSVFNEK